MKDKKYSSGKFPDFSIEKTFWNKGFVVIGVDEVGKGAVAGPVVAACAATKIQNSKFKIQKHNSKLKSLERLGIDDSKRLTRKKREGLEPKIKKYFYYGIGEATVGEINKFGIVRATRLGMKRAIRQCKVSLRGAKRRSDPVGICKSGWDCRASLAMTLLVDGRRVRGIGNQVAIVKGDQKSISIAAASILAKVYRDKLMRDLSGKYKGYGFERHVGYGTKHHGLMIRKLGMCEIHRVGFVRSLLKNSITTINQ